MADWILDDVLRVTGVRHAVLATTDGLVSVKSEGLKTDAAQRLAAGCAALAGVATGLARDHANSTTPPRQVVVELDGALLFVRRGRDTYLAVVADHAVDPASLGHALKIVLTAIGN
ncbi:roadblock/LC7 domain-containing protein [Actinomadura napierensis]|uniref:Roadblock/LAMTOR2 domain-containing protein n=1 Tax=Actinomadura napierensis TaxID=267854 RepID=A0ABP5M5N9_9ACTN